jgi:hypothetical protein
LREARDREWRKRYGWFTHTSTIGLNVAGFLAVGLYTDNWTLATLGALGGSFVGYVSVFTAPSAFLDDHPWLEKMSVTPSLQPGGGGLQLVGRF